MVASLRGWCCHHAFINRFVITSTLRFKSSSVPKYIFNELWAAWKKTFASSCIFFAPGYYSAKVTDWRILGSLPAVTKDFYLLQNTHPGSVVSTHFPIQWMKAFFTGINQQGL
jgi:hypothetical protein